VKTGISTQSMFVIILLIPSIAFSAIGFVVYLQLQYEISYNDSVEHTQKIVGLLANIKEDFLNAETGVRGFTITGDESYLDPYYVGIQDIESHFNQLQALTSDNQEQQQNTIKLKIKGHERLDNLEKILQAKKHGEINLAFFDDSKQSMDELRMIISEMLSKESSQLSVSKSNVEDSEKLALQLISVGFPVIIMISVLSIVFLYFYMKKRTRMEFELENKSLQMKEIDDQKSEFSTMITHELKTPLVPITVYCKMLKSDMLGSITKEQLEAISVIEKNAKSLDHLINDILDARKLDVKKLKFNLEDTNIKEFFDEIYTGHNPVISQNGNKLVMTILDKNMIIKTDKIRLRQVFDNLLSNAIKFMPEKNGLIQIGTTKEENNIIFYVKDNGLGIPLDKQDEIFKKFYQVDTSARRKITGTGLGLAISKGIVEQLGGKIWFESDGVRGTTFFIQLSLSEKT